MLLSAYLGTRGSCSVKESRLSVPLFSGPYPKPTPSFLELEPCSLRQHIYLRARAFHLWEVEPFHQKALVAAADRSAEICQDGLRLPPSGAVPVWLTLRAGDDFLTSSGHLPKGRVSEKGMQIGAE